MSVNTIVRLSLLNFLIYQHNAFALFHQIPCTRKLCHRKLSSTVTKTYSTVSVETDKATAAKLIFHQKPPQDVATNRIKSHPFAQQNRSLVVKNDDADEKDAFSLKLTKLQDLANEGNGIIQKLRGTAYSMIEASENNVCLIDDFECETSEENYHEALKVAREADLKFGLGCEESLKAWATVDKMYMQLETYNSKKKDIATDENKLDDILVACTNLQTAFRELQHKIDGNHRGKG